MIAGDWKKEASGWTRARNYVSLMAKRQKEGHLSVVRQACEMALLAATTGNGPGYYLTAGFYRRDVSWSDKRSHLGEAEYRKRLMDLNPVEYRKISQSKLTEKGLLSLLGFPTPEFFGYYHPIYGRTFDGSGLRSSEDLERLFCSLGERRLCIKLIEGWGGRGFEVADVHLDRGKCFITVASMRGQRTTVEDYVRTAIDRGGGGGRLIESFVQQHPAMAAFNPSSVNTCRIWVMKDAEAPARTLFGYLRLGRGGSLVDNHSAGGIVAPIALESGVLGEAIDGLPARCTHARHPDHGAQIVGQQVPMWPAAKALAESCLDIFPRVQFAGADIAIGLEGPVVLELNVSPDREGAAFVGVPSGRVLQATLANY